MNWKRLYILVLALCTTGYIWFLLNTLLNSQLPGLCLFRRATGIPCPACGTMRSVQAFYSGNFGEALYQNPFGLIAALGGVVLPAWIVVDWSRGKQSFYNFFNRFESRTSKGWGIAILIIIIVLVWAWNLYKHFSA